MAAILTAELLAHLRTGMVEPFARPHADCCAFVADWVLARSGVDPAADLRGAYAGAAGALRLTRAWGGMEAMWRVHMALAGFVTTRRPEDGDVGVVRDAAGQIVPAIRTGGMWAAKSRGVTIEDFPMLVAWTLSRG